jgi:tetratricopeptide (TPR) repeat protein
VSQGDQHEVARETVERFAAERASAAERSLVLRHLLAGCPACIAVLLPPPVPLDAYDAPFDRAEAAFLKVVAKERAERLLRELEAHPAEQRELRVRNARRFTSVELAELLAERSVAEARNGPRGAWLAARAAVAAAEGAARAPSASPEAAHDALARAWSVLGNAHRLRSEVPEAEAAFAAALGFLQRGSGGPAPRAWYCRALASLRIFRRELAEAHALASEAAVLYHHLGDTRGEADAEIAVGLVALYAGDPRAAFAPLERGMALAERCGDEHLWRNAIGNLVRCHIELGQLREAHAMFLAAGALFALCEEGIVALRWVWTGALVERDLGLLESAAARLVEVREGLLERDLRVEVADVSLDLIGVYLRLGDGAGVLRTVGETLPIYAAVGATRELLATLIELTKIAHQQEKALAALGTAAQQIRGLLPGHGG